MQIASMAFCGQPFPAGKYIYREPNSTQVMGLAVSERHPYMFSCGLDKQVKCWDLEQNKVIRNYHGHLSGVYSLAQHPTLDVIMTGGRDSGTRVWWLAI